MDQYSQEEIIAVAKQFGDDMLRGDTYLSLSKEEDIRTWISVLRKAAAKMEKVLIAYRKREKV